jgi:agmatinase
MFESLAGWYHERTAPSEVDPARREIMRSRRGDRLGRTASPLRGPSGPGRRHPRRRRGVPLSRRESTGVTNLLTAVPQGHPTFLDVPRCPDLRTLAADVAVLGVPFGVPYDLQTAAAQSRAPAALREQSMRYVPWYQTHYDFEFGGDLFAGRAVRIVDCGDVAMKPGRWEDNTRAATDAVTAILGRGAVPFVLGGDDSIPIPVLRAYAEQPPMCMVQVDAHIDWRDEREGIREGLSSPMRRASEMPWVRGMAQIGLRGFGSARRAEFDDARAYGSVLIGADDVRRAGVDAVLARIPAAERYYITLDMDALDPSIAPAVASPAFGGLAYPEVAGLFRGIAARGRVAGFDIVEIVPDSDFGGLTSRLGARLMLTLLGALAHTHQIG